VKKSKILSLLVSFAAAFGLWLFVMTNVSQEDDRTYYNVPVVVAGESILNEQNLIITGTSADTVSLHLSGPRSDLNKISTSGNLAVRVDVSKIQEPGERIEMNYTPVYPADVAAGSIAVETRKPASILFDVDYRRTKELPVQIKWVGTRSEDYLYDTENAVLDNFKVIAVGPAAVVDTIDHAEIEVDLTGRVESIAESYRYTLCNVDGEPVDAEDVAMNVEEVRLEMPIRRLREVTLAVNLNYGGGATVANTTVAIAPDIIRVSGGEKVLEELGDTYILGTVNLAELDKTSNELIFPITLPEGVTNQTGVSEAKVTVSFAGLITKEFTIEDFHMLNIPDGMEAEIINASLTVKLRGTAEQISAMTEENLYAEVDFVNAEAGTATYRARVVLTDPNSSVGALGSYTVTARVQAEKE